jgi:F-type H+-transporting ATPase subunit epsilon
MLHLEVITPTGVVLSASTDAVTAPGSEGEFQVLPSHLPTLALLGGGQLSYTAKGEARHLFVRGGVIEVTQDAENPAEGHVLVLTEETQSVDALDLKRAQALQEAAQTELASGDYLSDERESKIRQDLGFAAAVLAQA